MPGHIWREGGRGPCVACKAQNGAPRPCAARLSEYPNREPGRAQEGKRDGWCGGGGLRHNEGARSPDGGVW